MSEKLNVEIVTGDVPPRYRSSEQEPLQNATTVQPKLQSNQSLQGVIGPGRMTFETNSVQGVCFHCKQLVQTITTESPNSLCCFCFGCWAMCCPGCQDVQHQCPNCHAILGNYQPCSI